MAAAAETRTSPRATRVRVAPAPAPRSLSRQVRDSMSPIQTEAPVRSCQVIRVRRRMGVR